MRLRILRHVHTYDLGALSPGDVVNVEPEWRAEAYVTQGLGTPADEAAPEVAAVEPPENTARRTRPPKGREP